MRGKGEMAGSAFDSELKKLQGAFNDPRIPFGDIIEQYHSALSGRGSIHLEKQLLHTFSPKAGGGAIPRMYRGLPRYFRRDYPADFRIKEHFTHLPTLKRLAIEKILFRRYERPSLFTSAKLTLLTWVIGDGWGDYIAAFEMIELLKKRFPDWELSWVVLFPQRFSAPPTPKSCKTHLVFYDKEAKLALIDRESLEILRTSDIILHSPTFFPDFSALQEAVSNIAFSRPTPQWLSIGEYGFVESKWYHPCSGNCSMGLHFLEKGILIRETPTEQFPSFASIKNEQMLQWLFGTTEPDHTAMARYREENRFYLAYLSSPIGGAIYLHALIKAHENEQKGLDLCVPDVGWLLHYIDAQMRAGRPVLEIEGVALALYYQGKYVSFAKGTETKAMRIFCPEGLLAEDFRRLIQLSEEFVGIRGNQSFSEVVSHNKVFFYDGREHARYFLKDLVALAENRIGAYKGAIKVFRAMADAFLYTLPLQEGAWVDETYFQGKKEWISIAMSLGLALQDPETASGFKKLSRILTEEHSFNDFLGDALQRQLQHRLHPTSAEREAALVRPFTEGEIKLSQLLIHIQQWNPYGIF